MVLFLTSKNQTNQIKYKPLKQTIMSVTKEMTVKQLKEVAKQKEISGYSKMTKEQLLKALDKAPKKEATASKNSFPGEY